MCGAVDSAPPPRELNSAPHFRPARRSESHGLSLAETRGEGLGNKLGRPATAELELPDPRDSPHLTGSTPTPMLSRSLRCLLPGELNYVGVSPSRNAKMQCADALCDDWFWLERLTC